MKAGFGYQQTQVMGNDEWLTPPKIIEALGSFDLDPCAPVVRPWDTAQNHFTKEDDGLKCVWTGRVWLNPPYGDECFKWLQRLYHHQNGIALVFARTGRKAFHELVWDKAHAIFFFKGRIHFHYVDGTRAKHNGGGDSCLISYNGPNTEKIRESGLNGKLILL